MMLYSQKETLNQYGGGTNQAYNTDFTSTEVNLGGAYKPSYEMRVMF